jgi:hypothetical protein
MPQPYQRPLYDDRASSARMSDLIRNRGAIAADQQARSGQIWGGYTQQMGNTVARSLADVARARNYEAETAKDRAQTAAIEQKTRNEANLKGVLQKVGHLPPQEAADVLRREGYSDEASKLLKESTALISAQLDLDKAQYDKAQRGLATALGYLDSVGKAPAAAQAAQYQTVLPKIREALGTELGALLPDQFDANLYPQMIGFGTSLEQRVKEHAEATDLAKQAAAAENMAQADKLWTQSLARMFKGASSQEEWDGVLAKAKGYVPSVTLAKFGEAFSPEAAAHAATFLDPEKAESPGSPEQQAIKAALSGDKKTYGTVIRTLADVAGARREPDKPPKPDGPNRDDLAASGRWRVEQIRLINGSDMPEDQKAAAREQVELEYQTQTGGRPRRTMRDQVDPALRGWQMPAAGPNASVADPRAYQPPPPVAQPPAAPATAATGRTATPVASNQPPQSIADALLREGPGEYDLSDGTTWAVLPSGEIRRVK